MSRPLAAPSSAACSTGSGARGSGVRSYISVRISPPDIPSTAAWWIFVIRATRPRSSPWIRYSSQSGRERSSWRE